MKQTALISKQKKICKISRKNQIKKITKDKGLIQSQMLIKQAE